MLLEASLVNKAGIPIWIRSNGPSMISGELTGAMLGALSMFSSEITGQAIRTIEMSGGYRLHLRPFETAGLNLAIVGDENILSDPELLKLIDTLDEELKLMLKGSVVDLVDTNTMSIYLEDIIGKFDDWYSSRIFNQVEVHQARTEQVIKVSSSITLMANRISQEKIAVMILDNFLEVLHISPTDQLTSDFLHVLKSHIKGWIKTSSHSTLLLPEILFFDDACVGIKATKRMYVICAIHRTGSMGDQQVTSKVRSWLSMLSRRIN